MQFLQFFIEIFLKNFEKSSESRGSAPDRQFLNIAKSYSSFILFPRKQLFIQDFANGGGGTGSNGEFFFTSEE